MIQVRLTMTKILSIAVLIVGTVYAFMTKDGGVLNTALIVSAAVMTGKSTLDALTYDKKGE